MKNAFVLIMLLALSGCNQAQKKDSNMAEPIETEPNSGIGDGAVSPAVAFAQSIENTHNKSAWNDHTAVAFDINLKFGGSERLNAKITSLTNSSKIRIDKENGDKLVYDGAEVFLCPQTAVDKGARFDMFTWQYFFAMPFKLTDPGTNWESMPTRKQDSMEYPTGRLTFGDNIGDAPDDWYIIYQNPKNNLLHAAAYVVTFGSELEKANENPHAIVYSNYVKVDSVNMATHWDFHEWNETDGIGKKLGEADLSDIVFFDAQADLFEKPENSKIITK
ncbi:hypothetical protein SAMN04487764_1906 [Gillisia sp. Hel1_33_143]|uniref:hypothetical protein n=1 Tax=Gillisia sp. Hel1_33_143 TaxID=1336796 RepID=UPI00087AD9B0|nr:hypothetical protein [Gillisia sp. Hel1_33_143]SDS30147.1 hypothetical protein SAMN04487764_1906 [Gillisia sp. Hel1_33_143]